MTSAAGPSPTSKAANSRPQLSQNGAIVSTPRNSAPRPQRGQRAKRLARATLELACMSACRHRALPPHKDAGEQEEPHHVDEVPVPGRSFETEMTRRGELAGHSAEEADSEEDRADDDVEAVKARRHEEGRAIDVARIGERCVAVLIGLERGEAHAEDNGERKAAHCVPLIARL